KRAERTMGAFTSALTERPWAHDIMLLGVDAFHGGPKDVVLASVAHADATDATRAREQALLDTFGTTYSPHAVLVRPGSLPWTAGKRPRKGMPTVYVCERGRCDLPTSDPAVFAQQLLDVKPYPAR
ncbi:MAG: hypothetical protein AAGA56_31705, partial [Myxococcota bacterium]